MRTIFLLACLVILAFIMFPVGVFIDVVGYPLHYAHRKLGGEDPEPLFVFTPTVVGMCTDIFEELNETYRS